MQQGPLTEAELEWLDDILMKYGSEASVVDASELDGLFTAILSGPVLVEPQQWLPVIWGGEEDQEFIVVEDWCFGYMKGVALGDWSSLPVALQPELATIALHGNEENLARLEKLTPEEYGQSVEAIRSAAISLHAKWLLH